MELTLLLNNILSIIQQSSHFQKHPLTSLTLSSISFFHLFILVRQIFGGKYATLNSLVELILEQESSHVIQSNVFVFLECWNQVLEWFRNEFPQVTCFQQVCGQDFLDIQSNSKTIIPVLEWFISQYTPQRKSTTTTTTTNIKASTPLPPPPSPSLPLPLPPVSPSSKIKSLVQQFDGTSSKNDTNKIKMEQIRRQNTSLQQNESIYDEDVAQKIQHLKMNFVNRSQSFSTLPLESTSPNSSHDRHASLTTQQISLLLQQQQKQQDDSKVRQESPSDKHRHRSYTVNGLQKPSSPTLPSSTKPLPPPLPPTTRQELKIASPLQFQRQSVSITANNLVSLQNSLSSSKLADLEFVSKSPASPSVSNSTSTTSLPKEFQLYERLIVKDVTIYNIPLEKYQEARSILTRTHFDIASCMALLQHHLFSNPQVAQQTLFFCKEDEEELRLLLSLFVNRRAVLQYPHKIVPPTEKNFVMKYRHLLWKEPRLFCRVVCTLCMPVTNSIDSQTNTEPHSSNVLLDSTVQQELCQTWIPYYMIHGQYLTMEDILELLCCNSLTHELCNALVVHLLQHFYSVQEVSLFVLQLMNTLRYASLQKVMQGSHPLFTYLLQLCSSASNSEQHIRLLSELFWYSTVECCTGNKNSHSVALLYQQWYQQLIIALKHVSHQLPLAEWISSQQQLDSCLRKLSQELKQDTSLTRNQKIAKLRGILKLQGAPYYWEQLFKTPFVLPCCHKSATKMVSGEAKIFKSAMEPLCLSFVTPQHENSVQLIYKHGDDLRQDQLILQMIRVIDVILKANQLDCCLTPYGVTATSATSGFVELVPNSMTIASILQKYKSLSNFFKSKAKEFVDTQSTDFTMEQILDGFMNQFVKSCAGYCVITYLLGIGDRHLDNLLLDHQGKFFHIDFGFICGKDPKPYPAPMRITTEMIEGMGGMHSKYFVQFQTFACLIFKILRRYGNMLQLMMYSLMDANLPCLSGSQNVYNVRRIVDCRLRLDLSDKDSDKMILETLHYSVNMLGPKIMEQFHKIAQAFRN